MIKWCFILCFLAANTGAFAQDSKEYGKLYDPEADIRQDIAAALELAKATDRFVMLQVGGNWCYWCIQFHAVVEQDDTLSRMLKDNFVFVPVNFDQHNKSDAIWSELGYPQRFGFPVFVIVDAEGKRVHTQNSAYLEKEKSYDPKRIADFFKQWTPAALEGKTVRR